MVNHWDKLNKITILINNMRGIVRTILISKKKAENA